MLLRQLAEQGALNFPEGDHVALKFPVFLKEGLVYQVQLGHNRGLEVGYHMVELLSHVGEVSRGPRFLAVDLLLEKAEIVILLTEQE